jgi:hypothetical protein
MDDASRLVTGYGVFQDPTAENTIRVLEQAIAKYGCPLEMLTDRGSQFYASEGERKEKGISQFEQHLADRGIKHILCRVNHPQTDGKLERFYGVYYRKEHQFKSIDEYVHWRNEINPHLSLNYDTPIQTFKKKLPLKKKETIQTTQDAKQPHVERNHKSGLDDSISKYVGLDVHKKYHQAAVVDNEGTILKEARVPNDIKEIERFFADIEASKIAIESSSAWYHIYESLSKRFQVVLSNPVKTKAIASAKVKMDRLDALTLANLLRGGYIAESYVPSRRIMDLRGLVRHRAGLVRIRTSLKNEIHAHLLMLKREEF